MKNFKRFLTVLTLIISSNIVAQQGINYKALVKDGGGNVIANQTIAVQFQVLQGSGLTNVYQETHSPTTNSNGIVIINIGQGVVDSGVFNDIDWGSDDHFLNAQINTGSGFVDMGTTQFMAVPYALSTVNSVTEINELRDGMAPHNGSSLFLGEQSGINDAGDPNSRNVGVGPFALRDNTEGVLNTALGFGVLGFTTTGSGNSAFGYLSQSNSPLGSSNASFGSHTLFFNYTGNENTAIGNGSMVNNEIGNENSAIGYKSLWGNEEGSQNTAVGFRAGHGNINGNSNIFLGYRSGYNETNSNKLYIENTDADSNNALIYGEFGADNTTNGNILRTNSEFQIGNPTLNGYKFPISDGSSDQVLQTDGNGNLNWAAVSGGTVGATSLNDLSDAKSDNDGSNNGSSIFIGIGAGSNDDLSDNKNVGIGFEALNNNSTSSGLIAIGYKALHNFSDPNTGALAIGYQALYSNTASNPNFAIGYNALYSNTTGIYNMAIGSGSLIDNETGSYNVGVGFGTLTDIAIGDRNTAIGHLSVFKNVSGSSNTALGNNSLFFNTSGSNNLALGKDAGYNNLGSANVFIGHQSGYNETTSNSLYIDNSDADSNNALIYGQFGADNTSTGNILRTNSEFQIGNPASGGYSFPNGDGATNQILQTDGGGNLSWTTLSGGSGVVNLNDLSDAKSDNDESDNGSSIFIGVNAGMNDDGSNNRNVGIGYESLKNNNGFSNVAIGYKSLTNNANAFGNSSVGANSLEANTIGIANTAMGASALSNNIDGGNNTAVGQGALYSNISGNFNTAVGDGSLSDNTTGGSNSALGWGALDKNITGQENVAIGIQALRFNEAQNNNTAIGTYALRDNVLGTGNTATGHSAHYKNVHGDNNTAIGFEALNKSWLGNSNTALGYRALFDVTTGENNIAIGSDSQVPDGSLDNQVRIGNTDVTYAGVQVAWTVTSDKHWKDKIRELPYGLGVVKLLKPVDYVRKNNEYKTREMGFIAQDVEQLLTKIGYDNQGILTKDDKGFISLRYNDFIALLTKAIQEQQEIIEKQNNEIKSLTAEQQATDQRLNKIEEFLKISQQ